MIDTLLSELDKALKILTTKPVPRRTRPDKTIKEDNALNQKERVLSARLMRVNHTGEVCAQGLYQGQLFFNISLRIIFTKPITNIANIQSITFII